MPRPFCPPRVLVLRWPARCTETRRHLPAGSRAWWANGAAYGTDTNAARRFALAAMKSGRDPVDWKTAAAGA